MWFGVLGPVQVRRDDAAMEITGALRLHLLATLLSRANEPCSADMLVERLWPGKSGVAEAKRLPVLVHRLRLILDDPERLSFSAGGYRLRVEPDELDATQFGALLEQADAVVDADPTRGAELIRAAMDLWRGPPYQGTDLPDLEPETHRLTERRVAAMEQLYTAELRRGKHAATIADVTELIAKHPLRERLHGLLMTALYQSGHQDEALTAYRRARTTLVDELGLEPGPELRALEATILAGEPIELAALPTQQAPDRATPAQLPRPVPGFVGRAPELAALDAMDAPIMLVTGTAGVGKTALVTMWAHRVAHRFGDGQLYLDLRGHSPDERVSVSEALGMWLRALGADVPRETAERSALLRTLLADRRMLLVVDNAGSGDQVRPLLPGAPGCLVVVTSRDALSGLVARDGAQRLELDLMGHDEARDLLRELVGEEADAAPEATAQVIRRCARLPLALRIAAERIRAHGTAQLLAELGNQRAALDALDAGGDPDVAVRAVFATSYRHLDAAAARLFRLLGAHFGRDIDLYAATALVGNPDTDSTRAQLDTLAHAYLLTEMVPGRYQQHDLLRVYAGELVDITEKPSALVRLLDYYLIVTCRAADIIDPLEQPLPTVKVGWVAATPDIDDYTAALAWLSTERPNLVAAGMTGHTGDFSTALASYLDLDGYIHDAAYLHSRAVEVAAARGNLVAHGTALRNLGLLKSRTGDTADGLYDVQQALTLHRRAGDPLAEAASVGILGALYGFRGETEAAIRQLTRSIELYRSTDHAPLAFRPLTFLGHLHRQAEEWDQAEELLSEALAIADTIELPLAQAHAHRGLVALYRDRGKLDEAVRHGHSAVDAARTGNIAFMEGLAWNRLATLYRELGDYPQALQCHNEALTIFGTGHHTTLRELAEKNASRTSQTHPRGSLP